MASLMGHLEGKGREFDADDPYYLGFLSLERLSQRSPISAATTITSTAIDNPTTIPVALEMPYLEATQIPTAPIIPNQQNVRRAEKSTTILVHEYVCTYVYCTYNGRKGC